MQSVIRILLLFTLFLCFELTSFSQFDADFTSDKTVVCSGSTVTFTDASSHSPQATTYAWDFGEGADPRTDTGKGPHVVTYIGSGFSTVSLTIEVAQADTETKIDYISVIATPEVPVVSVQQPDCENQTGTITFNEQTGVEYSIGSGYQNDRVFPGLSPGEYNPSVRSFENPDCISYAASTVVIDEFTISEGSLPRPSDISGTNQVCEGSNDLVYSINPVDGATNYNWTVPDGWTITAGTGTISITVSLTPQALSGNISVIATNNCETSNPRSIAVTVLENSIPPESISITNNNTCFGTSKTLTVNGGNLASESEWHWYSGSCGGTAAGTGNSITVNPPEDSNTSYFVRAEGNCNTTECVSGTVTVPASVENPSFISPENSIICQGSSNSSFTTLATNATSYNWTVNGAGNSISGTQNTGTVSWGNSFSGTATISVSANGCNGPSSTISTTVTVRPQPTASVSGTTTVCRLATSPHITFTNPNSFPVNVIYNINGSNQTSISIGSNSSETVSVPTNVSGTFTYNLVSAAYQTGTECSTNLSGSATITVNPLPSAPINSSDDDNTFCSGSSITFSSSGGSNYNFRIGTTSQQNGASGTFTTNSLTNGQRVSVVVTNSFGCTATSPEIINYVNAIPFLSISSNAVCSPDLNTYSVSVAASPGSISSTAGNVTNNGGNIWTIAGIPEGRNITITITDFNTCENSIGITAPDCSCPNTISAPESDGNKTFCSNGTIPSITAIPGIGETVDWYSSSMGGTRLLSGSMSYTPQSAGTFYAAARDLTSGCTSSTRTAISVSMLNSPSADPGAQLSSICQGGTSVPLGGSIGGTATGGIWTSSAGGSFNPGPISLNATWTPPSGFSGLAILTLSTTGGTCGSATANKSQLVNPSPSVSITSTLNAICEEESSVALGGSIGGSATGGLWSSSAGGSFSPSPTTLNARWSPPEGFHGTADLTLSSTGGTCGSATESKAQIVNMLPTVSAGTDLTSICQGETTVALNAAIGGSATGAIWSTPAGGTFTPDATTLSARWTPPTSFSGTATLTITTSGGTCGSRTASKTQLVELRPTVNAGPSLEPICQESSSVALDGSVGGSATGGIWSSTAGGSFTPTPTSLNARWTPDEGYSGTAILKLTTSGGSCKAESAEKSQVVNLLPRVSIGTETDPFCQGSQSTALNGSIGGAATGGSWTSDAGGIFTPNSTSLNASWTPPSDFFGTATLKLSTTGGSCGSVTSEKELVVIKTPQPKAGDDGEVCDLNFNLNAEDGDYQGTWTQLSGPGSSIFNPNSGNPKSMVTVSAPGSYLYLWTETNTRCSESDTAEVVFNEQPVASAGNGGNNCGLIFTLTGTPTGTSGKWTKVAGPGTATFSPANNDPNAQVTVSSYGNYTFRWSVFNGICGDSANVNVNFLAQASADAGEGGQGCDNKFLLKSEGTGIWSKVSGPGNLSFAPSASNPGATVSADQPGTYVIGWTITNSACSSTDVVTVTLDEPPFIFAGRDTAVCLGSDIHLSATGIGKFSWEPDNLLNNPGISNPIATLNQSTKITVNIEDENGCKNSDEINVEVLNNPLAFAGNDKVLDNIFSAKLDAPNLSAYETGIWTKIYGSGIIKNLNDPKTEVTNLAMGQNIFVWTVNNQVCPLSSDTIVISVMDIVTPSLITPNNDGINDFFIVSSLESYGQTELIIFDRRGMEVYKNENYQNNWNGIDYNGNPLPDDTYFYILNPQRGVSTSKFIVIRR